MQVHSIIFLADEPDLISMTDENVELRLGMLTDRIFQTWQTGCVASVVRMRTEEHRDPSEIEPLSPGSGVSIAGTLANTGSDYDDGTRPKIWTKKVVGKQRRLSNMPRSNGFASFSPQQKKTKKQKNPKILVRGMYEKRSPVSKPLSLRYGMQISSTNDVVMPQNALL